MTGIFCSSIVARCSGDGVGKKDATDFLFVDIRWDILVVVMLVAKHSARLPRLWTRSLAKMIGGVKSGSYVVWSTVRITQDERSYVRSVVRFVDNQF